MISIFGNSITPGDFFMVFVAVFLIAYFVYKEWPEFNRRVSGKAKEEAAAEGKSETIGERLCQLEKDLRDIRDMLARDYIRLNTSEKLARANAKAIRDSLEERQIIMQALMACLIGLQEVGANGPTGNAIDMINGYLNRQAHINQEVMQNAEAPLVNPNL